MSQHIAQVFHREGGDRDDLAFSDTNPTISRVIHTLTASRPITDLTFEVILKELVSLTIVNRKTFCPKPQSYTREH